MPTAAAPMARFWGEIILPSTPPLEFAAAMSMGERSAFWAADTCSAPKSALDEGSAFGGAAPGGAPRGGVDGGSDPLTAPPSQPRTGESRAKAAPAPASQ